MNYQRSAKVLAMNSARISETQTKRLLENSQQRQLFSAVTQLTQKVNHQNLFKTLTKKLPHAFLHVPLEGSQL